MTAVHIHLHGTLTVPLERLDDVLIALVQHIALTRAEPGCISFDVTEQSDQPGIFTVAEEFRSRAAFDAHQHRAAASDWAQVTRGMVRDFTVTERQA